MNRTELSDQYIELLKKSLLNELYIENEARLIHTFIRMAANKPLEFSHFFNIERSRPGLVDSLREIKLAGDTILLNRTTPDGKVVAAHDLRNVTELSHTMIGRNRLDNIQFCVETVLKDGIKGDFIETGIWRGGACIFMRGLLKAYGVTDRKIWAADSFEGVPPPTWPEDNGFEISAKVLPILAVSLEEVQGLFQRYDLLDEQVIFLKGWFKDTLPDAPIDRLAILRLDGDLYESTMDALNPLYKRLESGGFVIIDDYNSCPPCKHAITDFRERHGIREEMHIIDSQSVYWRKS